jgi:hypothetical protein
MNIEVKEDLEESLVTLSLLFTKRKRVDQEKLYFKSKDAARHLEENYKLPKGYKMGHCLNSSARADNDHRCEQEWTFTLIKEPAPKPTLIKEPAPKPKKTSSK